MIILEEISYSYVQLVVGLVIDDLKLHASKNQLADVSIKKYHHMIDCSCINLIMENSDCLIQA